MNIVFNLIFAVQILTALAMIGLVLIQHGKGADMGASFGSGASGSLFGATGSANFLSRSTAVCAAVFFAATLWLAYSSFERPRAETGSILDRPAAASAPAPMPATSGAAAIPVAPTGPTSPAAATGASAVPPPLAPATLTPAPAAPAASAFGAGAIPKQ